MIFGFIILIACNVLVVWSIFRDIIKRKHLGDILLKVRLGVLYYLWIIFFILSWIVIAFLLINRFKGLDLNIVFNLETLSLILAQEFVYLLVGAKFSLRIITAREIRETGITLGRWTINYCDIRKLEWLSENKLKITYDPGIAYLFYRQFKEKWSVKDDQIVELKKLLQEKYYDSF